MRLSKLVTNLKKSAIRTSSEKSTAPDTINLAQGVCAIPINDIIKQAACESIKQDHNLYSSCAGIEPLRQAIANKTHDFNRIKVDPATEVFISHGATGAFVCASMTLFNPGDEVILFEPFYGYHYNILNLLGIHGKFVSINLDDLSIDLQQLQAAITAKTRGIIICTPNNPTGKVFTQTELLNIGKLAEKHNLSIITDEIYEQITYPDHQHISIASLQAFKSRTITIAGFSKTYNMTGWRLGYASGPAPAIEKMSLVQDLLYICPVTPLQHALLSALQLPESYYQTMRQTYLTKRDKLIQTLQDLGFSVTVPQGAYYIMANFAQLNYADDITAADILFKQTNVMAVPGSAFYQDPSKGSQVIRICYAVTEPILDQAIKQLRDLKAIGARHQPNKI